MYVIHIERDNGKITLTLHVDDLLITSTSNNDIDWVIT